MTMKTDAFIFNTEAGKVIFYGRLAQHMAIEGRNQDLGGIKFSVEVGDIVRKLTRTIYNLSGHSVDIEIKSQPDVIFSTLGAAIKRAQEETAEQIKVGDVVRMKSGGPLMTVAATFSSGSAFCPGPRAILQWFDETKSQVCEAECATAALEKVEAVKP